MTLVSCLLYHTPHVRKREQWKVILDKVRKDLPELEEETIVSLITDPEGILSDVNRKRNAS